jgi:hypothetical protein
MEKGLWPVGPTPRREDSPPPPDPRPLIPESLPFLTFLGHFQTIPGKCEGRFFDVFRQLFELLLDSQSHKMAYILLFLVMSRAVILVLRLVGRILGRIKILKIALR